MTYGSRVHRSNRDNEFVHHRLDQPRYTDLSHTDTHWQTDRQTHHWAYLQTHPQTNIQSNRQKQTAAFARITPPISTSITPLKSLENRVKD